MVHKSKVARKHRTHTRFTMRRRNALECDQRKYNKVHTRDQNRARTVRHSFILLCMCCIQTLSLRHYVRSLSIRYNTRAVSITQC